MVTIKEVLNKSDMNAFVNFPEKLYRNNPYYVPGLKMDELATLNPQKNPAFDFCEAKYFLAYKNNELVGRVAGIINNAYIDKWKNKYVRFGWIDFIDDLDVSKALLEAVQQWAAQKGLEAIHGPLGFTDLDYEGCLIQGFEELGTMATIYNHPYYPVHFEKLGFKKDTDWVEYKIKPSLQLPEKIVKIADIVEKRLKLHVVKAKSPKEIKPYAPAIFDLINDAYSELYGVTPLTKRQVDYYIKAYFSFMRADYVSIILDEHGKLAAFGVTMPSLSKALQKTRGKLFPFGFLHILRAMKNNPIADLLMVAIRRDLQGKGVNALILKEINNSFVRNGVTWVETNIELEDNTKVQSMWDLFEKVQHKRRRCFIKHFA